MTTLYRQGEGVLLPLTPEQAQTVRGEYLHTTHMVLKEGEVTGHKHEVEGNVAVLAPTPQREVAPPWSLPHARTAVRVAGVSNAVLESSLYLTATGDFKVVHPEHGTLTMEKGDYLVFSQREYDEEKHRNVRD